MLFGGIGADGKPLNDVWILNLDKPSWSLIYMGHSDLCPPQVWCKAPCMPHTTDIAVCNIELPQ